MVKVSVLNLVLDSGNNRAEIEALAASAIEN